MSLEDVFGKGQVRKRREKSIEGKLYLLNKEKGK